MISTFHIYFSQRYLIHCLVILKPYPSDPHIARHAHFSSLPHLLPKILVAFLFFLSLVDAPLLLTSFQVFHTCFYLYCPINYIALPPQYFWHDHNFAPGRYFLWSWVSYFIVILGFHLHYKYLNLLHVRKNTKIRKAAHMCVCKLMCAQYLTNLQFKLQHL